MGIGGISVWQLLIVLLIVVLIFGTKKLRNMGGDLGSAVKNFKESINEGKEKAEEVTEEVTEEVEQLGNKLAESADEIKTDEVKEDKKTTS